MLSATSRIDYQHGCEEANKALVARGNIRNDVNECYRDDADERSLRHPGAPAPVRGGLTTKKQGLRHRVHDDGILLENGLRARQRVKVYQVVLG